jgi:hypothetical protein
VTDLPQIVQSYQVAHDRRDTDGALSAFAADAVVEDDGHTYRGLEAIRDWLSRASVQFTYSRTLTDVEAAGANTWLVRNRLEGDFPGGVVDLSYRFVLQDGLIAQLDIAP